ncbi:MarR family transcriptional regulator [uncultured Tateyamaria sp.]|uniref:MarR family winged helix-turn-helix transcriptional regulator n=1 Tax=uncultured Tateyamaria sp. TaxID=455651 RepID=UPI002602DF81|nr:MarR family transcriptional regulator [uncultured Tateyamaria sp.]
MTKERKLLDYVHVLMRVMLVSERTGPEHQHVIKFNALDFHTLSMLREAPGSLRASDMADQLGVAATTASSVIARLVKRGYVARAQNQVDRRAYDLTLTADGRRIAEAIHSQDLRNMGLFLSALTEDDQDQLLGLLGRVVGRVAMLEARDD